MAFKHQPREPEKRTSRLRFRISAREEAAIRERAAAAGMDVSAFVRISAQHMKIHTKVDSDAMAALAERREALCRLGESLKLWLSGQGGENLDPSQLLADISAEVGKADETVDRVILTAHG